MKIAVHVSYWPPHIGGIEVASESQVRALASAGQELNVITSNCGITLGSVKSYGYKLRRVWAWNFFEEKMDAAFPIFSPSLLWYSYKAVRDADIVHAHDAFYLTSLAAAFWARILRKPLILTQHVDLVSHPKKIVRWAQEAVYATTGKFVIRSSSKTIILNSRVANFLIGKHVDDSNIIFLPNSVDTELFKPVSKSKKLALRQKYHLPEDKTLALFVGRFVPKKGFTKLVNLEPINGLALVFVGGNAPNDYARSDHFFLGAIDRDDIADIFKLCDIFILPSEGEGFPVTIQEAMACGLPVITTDDPAYRPYGFDSDCIILIKPNADDITGAITSLMSDNYQQKQMSEYSRQYALAHFNLGIHTQKMLGIYREMLL